MISESSVKMLEIHVRYQDEDWVFPLGDGVYTIGRGPGCEISVPDPSISNEHAALNVDGEQILLYVNAGRRPVAIQGQFVSRASLTSGNVFSIGATSFRIMSARDDMNLIDLESVLRARPGAGGSSNLLPATSVADAAPVAQPPVISAQATSVRLLSQVYGLLREASDQQTLARSVLELVCRRLMATRALLASVEDPEQLKIIAVKGMPADADLKTLVSMSVLNQIICARQAVLIGDTDNCNGDNGRHESFGTKNIRAVACTPIFNSANPDKLMALLYVDKQDHSAQFSSHDAEVLIWLGQVYALLAQNLEMRRRLETEVTELKRVAVRNVQMVADSPAMVNVLYRAKKAADSDAAVLILGESGAGKECVASLIHQQSTRTNKPFVARNCAAIPEHLFESEMFGHKKGAFTGADKERMGAFLEANGGTLFLDEIGDLAYPHQTKLLRAIQERLVRPVGSDHDYPVDIRIVCATNKDLRECCGRREFREDLYYRIATVSLTVPPLRERREDIVPLARHFVRALSNGLRSLTPAAEDRLLWHSWPGNVRELCSVLEEAVIFAARNQIDVDDINLPSGKDGRIKLGGATLAEAERRHILHVLENVGGNRSEAAKVLDVARSTLLLKLRTYRHGK